jgi:acetylornithine deacetylase/succinyl-diaminopimelate desuccinylase-like protein
MKMYFWIMKKCFDYMEENRERFLSELFELLRIPSVSADPKYLTGMHSAADFIKKKLLEAGADQASILATNGHPLVYAEKIIDPVLPTVLVYGHYDVQPPDPIDLWDSPPFEPVLKEGKIFARGACDDKGQMYMHIKAFECMLRTETLPCNIKFMIEGEEEIGSPNLPEFIIANKTLLKSDVVLISDTSMLGNETPSITTGLRGLSYLEVEVTGPNRDLHSGIYGGAVANPINILCSMIAAMKDADDHILIPGFYDAVEIIAEQERKEMAAAPFDLEHYKKDLEIAAVQGEKNFSTLERVSIRPTLDVNGIWGGYTGEGSKTVLPSKAYAKISMRLVPNQSAAEITTLFKKYFESIAPPSVKVKVTPHHGGEPVLTRSDSKAYRAASKAMEQTFGKVPIPVRSGGSIPIVALFEKELGIKTVLLGFGLDTDAIHSPNENFGVFNFFKGIETIPYFYKFYQKEG